MDDQSRTDQKRQRPSFFASFLAFPARVAALIAATALGRFFHAYDKSCTAVSESRLANRLRDSRLHRLGAPLRSRLGELFTHSPLSRFFNGLGEMLRYTETRAYGILFGTFGLYTILVFVIRYFAQWARTGEQSALITGIVMTVCSIPLLFFSRPIYVTMQESGLISLFLYRLIGLPQYPYVKKERLTINPTVAFLLGSMLGIAGFFVHPLHLLGALAGIAAFWLLLFSPELCLYTALALCPLFFVFEHPSLLLAVVILTGSVSYLFKIMLGKRTFSFRPLDLTVLLLGLMYVLSTFFTHGGKTSVREALLYAALLLGYFLATNLLNTPAAISRAITALVTGGTVTALLGLYQQFAGRAVADWLDNAAYDYIAGRVTAAFGNPNVLATYLILLFPFVMAGILKKGSFGSRAASFFLFALFMGAIILTWSRGAWIGVFLSLAIFLFACNPATLYIWIPTVIGGLFALQHFDTAIFNRLGSVLSPMADSSISYRINTWRGAMAMASEHLLGGIGVGENAFHAIYPYYALSGIESAPHAHNLPLQYLCEFGIVGPLLLLLFIVIFFQCVISHRQEETNQAFRLYSLASSSGVLAVLIFGLTDHVFYNARIFFLFFAVAGIAAALSRVGRVERERSQPISDRESEAYTIELALSED